MSTKTPIIIVVKVLNGNRKFIGEENDMRNAKKD